MSAIELRKRLIDKIQKTENEDLLEEIYRFLDLDTNDIEIYKLNETQKKAIAEAREQVKNGVVLTEELANREIDKWLDR